jgi:hypothetical protein
LNIHIEDKDRKIANLMNNCIGAPNESLETPKVSDLEDKIERLERDLYRAKQDGGKK